MFCAAESPAKFALIAKLKTMVKFVILMKAGRSLEGKSPQGFRALTELP